jgi:hypothetical protein
MTTLGNPLLLGGEGYQISRSVRLRSSASAYFNRTLGSGSGTTSTLSVWLKRGAISATQAIMAVSPDSTNDTTLFIGSGNDLTFSSWNGGGRPLGILTTTQVFRDPSAWYHIVMVVDTTNATAANRLRMFVNGVQVTSFSTATYPSQNNTWYWNQAYSHRIGRYPDAGGGGNYLDGYLTEINFIDGQALTPASFGETDVITGVWKPKKYAGTYGTNGFYLNFSDPTAGATGIGKDNSGNGNNWTPNNISVTAGATYDSMIDVPTLWADGGNGRGNYCVWNAAAPPTVVSGTVTRSNGNLTSTDGGTTYGLASFGTIGVSSGKWYWETALSAAGGSYANIGIVDLNSPLLANVHTGITYSQGGNKGTGSNPFAGTGSSAYGATYASGDVIGTALDMDTGSITFYKNGVSQGVAYTGITGNYTPGVGDGQNSTSYTFDLNCGQRPFAYTPPTGFKALNTQNLPEPTIKKGNQWFDATTYTGTGASRSVTNAGGFPPDLVWAKGRNGVYNNVLQDAVRGAGLTLQSDQTAAEVNEGASGLTSFNSNGFTIGGSSGGWNANNVAYVAWQWKEGASAGFDIVTYTGTGANRTVAHSLGVAPSMMIIKRRSGSATQWAVYHQSLGNTNTIYLNLTNAQASQPTFWNSTTPTSSVFSLGTDTTVNANTETYVAYLFSEVAGFSKFGSYTGAGNTTDNTFVYCGFRPRYLMIKRVGSTGDWIIRDTTRDTENVDTTYLLANTSGVEEGATSYTLDILSNGFKLRHYSFAMSNTEQYIFAAFAEHPFKNSLAR